MLRAEVSAGTPLGRQVADTVSAGVLVSDELVNEIVVRRLGDPDCAGGFILDGYPRTVEQAKFLDRLVVERGLPGLVVVHLDVPPSVLASRISFRMQCPACLRNYNTSNQSPRRSGICDDDGTELVRRNDDSEKVMLERQKSYHLATGPVLEHYTSGRYLRLDGDRPPPEVFGKIREALASFGL